MNIGCKTGTDTGTSGPWGLRIGLGMVGPHGRWSLRQTDGKAPRNADRNIWSGTLRRRTASRHRRLGTTAPNVMLAGVIWMDFWIFTLLVEEGAVLDGQVGGPRFYHNFLAGDEWLWARGTKGVRLFYFLGGRWLYSWGSFGYCAVVFLIWSRLFWAG